jgi:hypothetical protein
MIMEQQQQKGCVYFFRHIGLSPVKIGYSTNESPINRFNQFKTYAPYGSEILGFIQTKDAKELESILHSKYASKRFNSEWFEISEEDVNREVDFYSNIEDIRERNEFQIAWANNLLQNKIKINSIIDPKQKFNEIYISNKNINRSKIAEQLGVTRQTIHIWIKELEL